MRQMTSDEVTLMFREKGYSSKIDETGRISVRMFDVDPWRFVGYVNNYVRSD